MFLQNDSSKNSSNQKSKSVAELWVYRHLGTLTLKKCISKICNSQNPLCLLWVLWVFVVNACGSVVW